MKNYLFIMLIGIIWPAISMSQEVAPAEIKNDSLKKNYELLLKDYGYRKKLPSGFEQQSLQALSHFPELKNVRVKFRLKHSYSTAKTRPTIISMFLPKKIRTYIITISNKTIDTLKPVMLQYLPYDAQVGLLGHELSHVSDFSKKNLLQSIANSFDHLSRKRMDKFEYNTDRIAVEHGLGQYLKAWSQYIRDTFHVKNWRGAAYVKVHDVTEERYMNPDTIEKLMQEIIASKKNAEPK